MQLNCVLFMHMHENKWYFLTIFGAKTTNPNHIPHWQMSRQTALTEFISRSSPLDARKRQRTGTGGKPKFVDLFCGMGGASQERCRLVRRCFGCRRVGFGYRSARSQPPNNHARVVRVAPRATLCHFRRRRGYLHARRRTKLSQANMQRMDFDEKPHSIWYDGTSIFAGIERLLGLRSR